MKNFKALLKATLVIILLAFLGLKSKAATCETAPANAFAQKAVTVQLAKTVE